MAKKLVISESYFANTLLILVLFPYISFFKTPFDTQPYAFFLCIIFFLLFMIKRIEFPLSIWGLFYLFLYSLLIYFIHSDLTNGIRSLVGYATLFVVTAVSYRTFKFVNEKIFIISVYIWFVVGTIQFLVDKNFGMSLLPRMSTTTDRGVTSLAVEPSYYAIMCTFFIILNDIFYKLGKYNNRTYILLMILNIIQIFISYSGMGLLLLMIYFFAKLFTILLRKLSIKRFLYIFLILILISLLIISFLITPILKNSRAGQIIVLLLEYGFSGIFIDASINDRFAHIFLSFYSLFYSFGLGMGLGTWHYYATNLLEIYSKYFSVDVDYFSTNRIMSGWGTAIYELGFIGLLLLAIFFYIFLQGIRFNNKLSQLYINSMIVLFIITLMAVPLAFPMLSYLLGIFIYLNRENFKAKGEQ